MHAPAYHIRSMAVSLTVNNSAAPDLCAANPPERRGGGARRHRAHDAGLAEAVESDLPTDSNSSCQPSRRGTRPGRQPQACRRSACILPLSCTACLAVPSCSSRKSSSTSPPLLRRGSAARLQPCCSSSRRRATHSGVDAAERCHAPGNDRCAAAHDKLAGERDVRGCQSMGGPTGRAGCGGKDEQLAQWARREEMGRHAERNVRPAERKTPIFLGAKEMRRVSPIFRSDQKRERKENTTRPPTISLGRGVKGEGFFERLFLCGELGAR
jgi:hypothetical protein